MQTRPEVEALIAGIRQQIETADRAIDDLQASRNDALLIGDSARLDEIEISVEQFRKENGRREERIALLDAALVKIDARDQAAYLESLRQRAAKAAQLGEEIIRKEYAPAAKKIGAAIEKLAALRGAIRDANHSLDRHGADQVPDFDANRHVPGWQPPPETKLIEIDARDSRHPNWESWRNCYRGLTTEQAERILSEWGTVEIEETKTPPRVGPSNAEILEETVNLPGVVGSDLYFWRGEYCRHGYTTMTERRSAELLASLLGDPAPAPDARNNDEHK